MKSFCYTNVVKVNWLKNYIILFFIVYLGSVTSDIKNQ